MSKLANVGMDELKNVIHGIVKAFEVSCSPDELRNAYRNLNGENLDAKVLDVSDLHLMDFLKAKCRDFCSVVNEGRDIVISRKSAEKTEDLNPIAKSGQKPCRFYAPIPPPIPPRRLPTAQAPEQPPPTMPPVSTITPSSIVSASIQQNINWYNLNAKLLHLPNLHPLTVRIIHNQMKISSDNIQRDLNIKTDILCNQAALAIREQSRLHPPAFTNPGQSSFGSRFRPPRPQRPAYTKRGEITFTKIVETNRGNSPDDEVQRSITESEVRSQTVANQTENVQMFEESERSSQAVVPLDVPSAQTQPARFDVLKDETFTMPRPSVKRVNTDEKFEIFIVKVDTPTDFWFQHGINESAELVRKMNEFYASNVDETDLKIQDIRQGLYVAAEIYGEWNRALALTAANADGCVSLRFIDFGSETLVPVKDIRFLLKEFAHHSIKAFRGSLDGVVPMSAEGSWSRTARMSFYQKVNNVSLQANIKGISTETDVYLLEMFINGSSIAEELIAEGVADAGQASDRFNAIFQ